MASNSLNLGIFALVGVIMLVMAGASFGYLLRVKNKSKPSRMLQWFFLCIIFSAIATILTNLGTDWGWAFAPLQDAFLLLGGIFLVQFAYSYPSEDQPDKAQWFFLIFTIIAFGAMAYAIYFALQFFRNLPSQLEEIQAFYLLSPISVLLMVIIFFNRSLHWSKKMDPMTDPDNGRMGFALNKLIKPKNVTAIALRNYGLSLSLGLIPVLLTLGVSFLSESINSFLFNFSVVMAIGAIMLVYLNYAPEPTTISAKLVDISLVTVLLILGLAGVWITVNVPQQDVHRYVLFFITLVLGSSLLIIIIFPLFFRSTLLNPLARLLEGVREANEGNLDVQVEVPFEDEVGFIAQSFNRMVETLKQQTTRLLGFGMEKEKEVAERTLELVYINRRLESENTERKLAESKLERMLTYEQALASCSQILLLSAENERDQYRILTEAMEQLRVATVTSRAYIFRNFLDPQDGECQAIIVETCGPGITPVLPNPFNQKVPWSILPEAIPAALKAGNSIGGLTEHIFSGNPFKKELLSQTPPLLSLLLFPIHIDTVWWGYVGFDDCESRREWGESEILLLRTASQMLGRSIQRWQLQGQLVETMGQLEQRVVERTQSLMEVNLRLSEEMDKRRQFQHDLEQRLNTERVLARISTRLLETTEIKGVMEAVLKDFGEIIQKGAVSLALMEQGKPLDESDLFHWQDAETQPFSPAVVRRLLGPKGWFTAQLREFQILQIDDIAKLPEKASSEKNLLARQGIVSLLLLPLSSEGVIRGVLLIGNTLPAADDSAYNLQVLEVLGSLLSNQLQREDLLRTLEMRVADQARELSTFYEMTVLSSGTQDMPDILYPALSRIQEISRSEAVTIHLYSPEEKVFELVAQRGIPEASIKSLERIPLRDDLSKWLHHPESDHGTKNKFPAGIPQEFHLPGFGLVLISKLRAAGDTLGVISCYRASDQPFTPFQSSILEIIGELLGVVVQNQRLTQEAGKLATVQERQRLARELHDAVSQSIYSLSLFARSAKDALEAGDKEKLLTNLDQLETNSLSALKEMRLLLYQLRTIALEEGDLVHAIETRFDLVERRSGIQAGIHFDDHLHLPPRIEQECFRVITEALNNALYYAEASRVFVDVHPENEHILVAVEDDGIGFDPSQIRAGLGMQNMRERAESLNGTVDITSQQGQGTCIYLRIPLTDIQSGDYSNE
jgi:signal transduction histidine kinase/HAMP domain-containing protein